MKKLKKVGKLFPSLKTTIAYYDPATFYITLNTISEKELIDIRANPFTSNNVENIKTIFHETRHNIDHIATLWGQKNILKYLKALDARLKNDTEKFDTIVNYKLEENQIFYATYYEEEYNYFEVDKMDRRWRWQPSSGLKFNAKGLIDETQPIPMIRFSTFDNKPLVRIPLSIASLLETNAVSEETKIHLSYIASLSKTEHPFQLKFFANDILFKLIYNQDLAVYNVAVHLTANLLNLTDIIEGFKISSIIATLALNLPNSLVTNLPIDKEYFEKWGNRTKLMLENNDYGFIFFVLLVNYRAIYSKKEKVDINDILDSSKLPKYEEIEILIDKEMEAIEKEIESSDNLKEVFLPKILAGRKIFKTLGLGFEKKTIYEAVYEHKFIPTIICNDTVIKEINYRASEIYKMQPIKNLDLSEWYNMSWTLNDKLTEFFEIRGV